MAQANYASFSSTGLRVRLLTIENWDDTISPLLTPPSSSGPGRGPLKAQTGVRVSLGAQKSDKTSQNSEDLEEFVAGLRFK